MWSAANSLSCAERSPIMTAAPGSMFPDQRLPIVPSCRQHKSVRSQHWSIINPVRFLHSSSTHCMPAGDSPDGFLVCRVADLASHRNLHLEWTFVFGFATVGLAKEAHGQHGENGSAFLRPSSDGRRSEDDPGNGWQLWRLDANGIGPDGL